MHSIKEGIVILLLAYVAHFTHGAYITELTDNNFFEYAKDKDFLLTDFYAPWCSDCQKLAPELDKAADTLGAKSADIAKVDCFGAGSGLCQMYGVRSWPQLKAFRKGTYVGDYTGTQSGDALAMYVESMAGMESPLAPAPASTATGNVQQAPYAAPVPAAPPAGSAVGQKNQKAESTTGDKTINHAKAIIHDHEQRKEQKGGKSRAGKLKLTHKAKQTSAARETHKDIKKVSEYRKKKSKRLNRKKLLLF